MYSSRGTISDEEPVVMVWIDEEPVVMVWIDEESVVID
jgi:hypothetical protein